MYYTCKTLDANNVCTEWVQLLPFGLPPLDMADALALSALIVGSWAISFSIVVLSRMFIKR